MRSDWERERLSNLRDALEFKLRVGGSPEDNARHERELSRVCAALQDPPEASRLGSNGEK